MIVAIVGDTDIKRVIIMISVDMNQLNEKINSERLKTVNEIMFGKM